MKVERAVQLHRFDTLCEESRALSPDREWATLPPLLAPLAVCSSCALQNIFVSTSLACLVKTVVLDFEPCMWDFSPLESIKRDEGSGSEEKSPCWTPVGLRYGDWQLYISFIYTAYNITVPYILLATCFS